jgi:hypothetical protein
MNVRIARLLNEAPLERSAILKPIYIWPEINHLTLAQGASTVRLRILPFGTGQLARNSAVILMASESTTD